MWYSVFRLARVLDSMDAHRGTGMPTSSVSVLTGAGLLVATVGFFLTHSLWVAAAGGGLLVLGLFIAVVQALADIVRQRRR